MKLENKVVVITGANKGLGKELAKTLIAKGALVTVSGRDQRGLEETTKELGAEWFAADVTKENEVSELATAVVAKHGRIDIWVNNAGIWMKHGPITELDTLKLHELIEVNLFGTVYGSKAALIQMKKQRAGTIINILSTSALEGRLGSSGYGASKYAALGFTKSLRLEGNESGVETLAVYPGGMQTHLFDEEKPDNYADYMQPKYVAEKIVSNLELDNPDEELVIK